MATKTSEIVIIGAGLSGLSAGSVLSRSGKTVAVIESNPGVGGLAATVRHHGFRFDLGGHRFITKNERIERFVLDILRDDILIVPRKSKIFMRKKYVDYPLRPANAVFGLGIPTTLRVLADYCAGRARHAFRPLTIDSLEDWVVDRFGRKVFDLYFREYSEKVWGIPCSAISKDWVAKRIEGLSLGKAIKNAFMKRSGAGINTLANTFLYPRQGIGAIADRLRDNIEAENIVLTNTRATEIHHENCSIAKVRVRRNEDFFDLEGGEYISSIPVTSLLRMLRPSAPRAVRIAAAQLRYRDLVIVTIMLNRETVTDLTWMYLPEKGIPFGRIHEPKNWSPGMAPDGTTHVVAEYFCFRGDAVWQARNEDLVATAVNHLCSMGFIASSDVIDSCVVRVPYAYPLFRVGYREHADTVMRYLKRFQNLHLVGRGGMFRYHNMDDAMASGIEAAEGILRKSFGNIRFELRSADQPFLVGAGI